MSFLNKLKDKAVKIKEDIASEENIERTSRIKEKATIYQEKISSKSKIYYESTREKVEASVSDVSTSLRDYNYDNLKDSSYYTERYSYYRELGASKVSGYFRSTFEVDKTTVEMVEGIRKKLPVKAETVDDIFDQCRKEAIQRAISSFALAGVIENIDTRSEAKYSNLSESYGEFRERSGHRLTADKNYADMGNIRDDARKGLVQLEDGYNKSAGLDPYSADIEHVIAKKEYYQDVLLRAGTTDDDLYTAINGSENLVFAESSLNRSLGDKNIYDYLNERGRVDDLNPDLIHVDIEQSDGLIKTVTVNKNDIDEAYNEAHKGRQSNRLSAVKEVGETAIKTGAAMAIQQVVGLIIVETIDIFIDEFKSISKEGNIVSENGLIKNTKDFADRVENRLSERFEERDIWRKAKKLGIESGVSGALSVIPQILISMIIKMPAFVLGIIRESTLSTVRCVRVMLSDEPEKLESIKVIMAGTASAVAGLYVGRVIGSAILGVPLLNKFNNQVTSVLSGLVVTAIPLIAIYTFEQNKNKIVLSLRKSSSEDVEL